MMSSTSFHLRLVIAALLAACAAPLGVQAQQTPITGQMGAPAPPPADAPVAPPAPAPSHATDNAAADSTAANSDVGDTTRMLLGMQRQGTHAGKPLPIPGQEASASYQRYLKSFEHPIPEFYDTTMSRNGNGGNSGTGSSSTP